MSTSEIDKATISSARARMLSEPEYSYAAAGLLLNVLYKEVFHHGVNQRTFNSDYRNAFIMNLKLLISKGFINPELETKYELDKLAAALKPDRDRNFKYLGIQTLYDRYFQKIDNQHLETPQAFWMRVAMGICLNEPNPTEAAIEAYELFSNFLYCPGTPTLFNSGTTHPQLSSCYLSTVDDSIDGIFGTIHGQARLSKYAGGLGVDWTPVRSLNSWINGTNGPSQGLIPWLKIFNDTLVAVNQGSKRKGAGCAYLETWHADMLDFLELRKNTGDERRRCHDMNTANWIPDLFMQQVRDDGEWYLFSPDETPDLHETHGEVFDEKYWQYVEQGKKGLLRTFETVRAKELWKKMLTSLYETGHPWVTWKDPSNIRYSNSHVGVVHSSNLCCVAGRGRVATTKGLITVKELADIGTRNLVAGRQDIVSASAMDMTIVNSPLVLVKTEEGYEHAVTPDHPLWVPGDGWVEAQHLEGGQFIELQQTFNVYGEQHNPELALIAGIVAGDGTYANDSVCIDIWNPKTFNLEVELTQSVKTVLQQNEDKYVVRTNAIEEPHFNGDNYKKRLSSALLAQVLESYGFNRETKNKVPDFVWKGDKETVSAYLRGLFAADGTIQANNDLTTVSLSSVNREFLKEIQILLINAGIKSRIRLMREECDKLMPDGKGGEKEYHCQTMYRLMITSIRSSQKLERMARIGETRNHQVFLKNIQKAGYKEKYWAVVESVTQLEPEDVYCLMVDANDRAWTCDGLLTKNTEILLHTKPSLYKDGKLQVTGETAVCNLGSINLSAHMLGDDWSIDWNKLGNTVKKAIRLLDNVIDLNFYPTDEARQSNLQNRPVGLGQMGWSDVLHLKRIPYDSEEAVRLAGQVQEYISYYAIMSSCELAVERGKYPTYQGSTWSKGELPIDTYKRLMSYKNHTDMYVECSMDWDWLTKIVADYGMRNSNTMAIAPTATISYILGCSQSTEPDFSVLYVYSTLSGEFTMLNEHFVTRMKEIGKWDENLIKQILLSDGDVSGLDIPDDIKEEYKTAFAVSYQSIIDAAAERQKWIDQGQSMNLYSDKTSLKYLSDMYFHAWEKGLKTTYYLRTKAASAVEKSTVTRAEQEQSACSIEAMKNGTQCEACQ